MVDALETDVDINIAKMLKIVIQNVLSECVIIDPYILNRQYKGYPKGKVNDSLEKYSPNIDWTPLNTYRQSSLIVNSDTITICY